jgi:NAD dependent epimerase/dehydratase family enzyme
MSVPAFVLRGLLGEVADEIFLTGQKVIPKKITDHGYHFKYPKLASALENIVHS